MRDLISLTCPRSARSADGCTDDLGVGGSRSAHRWTLVSAEPVTRSEPLMATQVMERECT